MLNRPCYSHFPAAFLACLFFILNGISAQRVEAGTNDSLVAVLVSENVETVSDRIAAMYGADINIVLTYVQTVVNYEDAIDIPATVIIGIAVYESSFTSHLFLNTGNPFSIKAGKDWKGPTFIKYDDGADTPFRVYGSVDEAVLDFGAFIGARSWYADARVCPDNDYVCVLDGLKKTDTEPGYSTTAEWDEKVMEIIQKLGLQELDTR